MKDSAWNDFKDRFYSNRELGFSLDISKVTSWKIDGALEGKIISSLAEMAELERGSIANKDENRMVGHYWLRSPSLAPNKNITEQIEETIRKIEDFVAEIHQGKIKSEKGKKFNSLLIVGIGGSALGPQFVTQALGSNNDSMKLYFFDNTDPDGMDKVLQNISNLEATLTVVISKSGGTKETRNGQLIAKAAYEAQGLSFAKHAVAVTGEGSELDAVAVSQGWIKRFPMWDWVGGRTSEFSAVGLLPAALQGYSIRELLRGASAMDASSRNSAWRENPAALLALCWYCIGEGRGSRDMVILPYKDRLELFSRYLQQLVMESLGKKLDRNGKTVTQGIAVYGNKGSTDQHAYVQQLRDGLDNFFALFIEVLQEKSDLTSTQSQTSFATSVEVEPGIFSGDYLSGFLQGTQVALYESGRQSITITIDALSEFSIGMLIALFERAVGLYASLVNINAYHQPGVEAGKKAAADVLKIQHQLLSALSEEKNPLSIEEISEKMGATVSTERLFRIARHLSANKRLGILSGKNVFEDRYHIVR